MGTFQTICAQGICFNQASFILFFLSIGTLKYHCWIQFSSWVIPSLSIKLEMNHIIREFCWCFSYSCRRLLTCFVIFVFIKFAFFFFSIILLMILIYDRIYTSSMLYLYVKSSSSKILHLFPQCSFSLNWRLKGINYSIRQNFMPGWWNFW